MKRRCKHNINHNELLRHGHRSTQKSKTVFTTLYRTVILKSHVFAYSSLTKPTYTHLINVLDVHMLVS